MIIIRMPHSPVHNVLFGQYVYLATEQAETYLKICVLIYHLTYICPSLFDCEVNTFFFHFCEFQTLNLQFPPCYSPVSTTGLQNIAPYQLLGYNCASVSATARGYDSLMLMFGFFYQIIPIHCYLLEVQRFQIERESGFCSE